MDAKPKAGEYELSQARGTAVIGTAGHIDHGKTALIRALTGVDTDRLPEEKRRGITIDLGFASMVVDGAGASWQFSFIDVPGHARFVRNMLAGAGGIDAVLLVISAEEGVKPQTEEHLAICSMLGIERGITVLTKTDAVDEARLSEVQASVRHFLSTTFLASEPMVCTSAITGAGLDELRRALDALARRIPPRNADRCTRLPLDRAFTVKGFGTVVTGTLISGSVGSGQEVTIEPGARTAKVRGIQVHGHSAPAAHAATRVALNLSHVDLSDLHRGDMLVEPGTVSAVDSIDVEVSLLPGSPPLKHRARLHFHAFASESMAAVSLYDYRPLQPGANGLARLRLAAPVVLLPGDRFVLRQGSPVATIGGGRVLDSHPLPRSKRQRTHEWLQSLREAPLAEELAMRVMRRGMDAISLAALSAETGLRIDAVRALLAPSLQNGRLIALENQDVLAQTAALEAKAQVERELGTLYRQSGAAGVKRSALRSHIGLRPEVLDFALRRMAEQGKVRMAGELLLPAAVDAGGTARDRERLAAICRAYEQAALAPPSTAELGSTLALDSAEMRRLITALLREKKLIRLDGESLFAHPGALAGLIQKIATFRGQTIDVARFKQLTGLSRKYAIPWLECLDRERITRKDGDHRIVL